MGGVLAAVTLGAGVPHLINAFAADTPWQWIVASCSIISAVGGLMALLLLREGPFIQKRKLVRRADLRRVFPPPHQLSVRMGCEHGLVKCAHQLSFRMEGVHNLVKCAWPHPLGGRAGCGCGQSRETKKAASTAIGGMLLFRRLKRNKEFCYATLASVCAAHRPPTMRLLRQCVPRTALPHTIGATSATFQLPL